MMGGLRALGAASAGCASGLCTDLDESLLICGAVAAVRCPRGTSSSLSDIARHPGGNRGEFSHAKQLRTEQLCLTSDHSPVSRRAARSITTRDQMRGKLTIRCEYGTQWRRSMLASGCRLPKLARARRKPATKCPIRGHLLTLLMVKLPCSINVGKMRGLDTEPSLCMRDRSLLRERIC